MSKYNLNIPFKQQSAREYFDKLCEKKVTIEIKELKGKRTIDQNSLYWLWLMCIQRENGMSKDHCHLLYRAMFLTKTDEHITKIIYTELWERVKRKINAFIYFDGLEDIIDLISYSTTYRDTKEMTVYMEKIRDHASENMGIRLLTLEEKSFQDFYNEYNQLD